MEDSPYVLRQARTAEGKARHKITPRDVELRITAEDVHYGFRVQFGLLADRGDFVREGDLQRMEGVAGIFHHERLLWLKHEEGGRWFGIERTQRLFGGHVIRPQNSKRRLLEITDRSTFSQEFRISTQLYQSGHGRLEYPPALVEYGWQYAAANYHDLLLAEFRESRCNLLASAKQMS